MLLLEYQFQISSIFRMWLVFPVNPCENHFSGSGKIFPELHGWRCQMIMLPEPSSIQFYPHTETGISKGRLNKFQSVHGKYAVSRASIQKGVLYLPSFCYLHFNRINFN